MKRTVTSIYFIICAGILLALGVVVVNLRSNRGLSIVPGAQAQTATQDDDPFNRARAQQCSVGTTRGRYAATVQGTVLGPNPVTVLSVGTFEQDSTGNIVGSDTASFGGQIIARTYTGTVMAQADCTTAVKITVQTGTPGLVFNLKGVIVDGGKEIHFIQSDPGTIISGVAKRL